MNIDYLFIYIFSFFEKKKKVEISFCFLALSVYFCCEGQAYVMFVLYPKTQKQTWVFKKIDGGPKKNLSISQDDMLYSNLINITMTSNLSTTQHHIFKFVNCDMQFFFLAPIQSFKSSILSFFILGLSKYQCFLISIFFVSFSKFINAKFLVYPTPLKFLKLCIQTESSKLWLNCSTKLYIYIYILCRGELLRLRAIAGTNHMVELWTTSFLS